MYRISRIFFPGLLIVLMFKTKDVNATNSTHDEDTATESFNKVFILKQVDYNLWKFAIPILYVVGTIGNSLTVVVLKR